MSERSKLAMAIWIDNFSMGLVVSFIWGSVFWLLAVLSQIWVSRTITMIIVAIATLMWSIGFIAICKTAFSVLKTRSSCKNHSVFLPRGDFKNRLDLIAPSTYPDNRDWLEKIHLN